MDLEGNMLSKISQKKTNTVHFHLCLESKKIKLMNKQNRDRLIDTEIRLTVAGQSSASLRCGPWTSSITCELVRNAGSKAPPQPCRICISKRPWDLCRSSGGRFNVTSGK